MSPLAAASSPAVRLSSGAIIYTHQQSDAADGGQEGGAAVGQKKKGDAGNGHDSHHHADIYKKMNHEHTEYAGGDVGAEFCRCNFDDVNGAEHDNHVKPKHEYPAEKAQFL